ncbi:MAG: hypothetical protein MMC33_006319 [Icmadophila ericetorum]|nr:hypothetical protein [Icmadophila ericetorum]
MFTSPPSPLLLLPPELRFQIYRHLRTYKTCFRPFPDLNFIPQTESGFHSSIFRVNKQIHSEATGILWGENIWHIDIHCGFEFQRQFASSMSVLLAKNHLYHHLKRLKLKFALHGIVLNYYPSLTLEAYVQATYEHAVKEFSRLARMKGLRVEICWFDDTGVGRWEKKKKVLEALRVLPKDAKWVVGCVMSDMLVGKDVFEEFVGKIMGERGGDVEYRRGGRAEEKVIDYAEMFEKTAPFY